MKQWLKDFTHHCIVHPVMVFIPKPLAHKLHDANADWVWGIENQVDELALEGVRPYKEVVEENERLKETIARHEAHIQQLYIDLNTPEGERE